MNFSSVLKNVNKSKLFLMAAVLFFVMSASGPLAAQEESSAEVPAVQANPPKTFLLVVPESGPLADLGRQARQGAELALKTWGGGYQLAVVPEGELDGTNIDLTQVAMVIGYFYETVFQQDARRFLHFKKPVLLPYLTNPEAAARGPYSFYRLLPGYDGQGRVMAMEILGMKTRPSRILIIEGEGQNQAQLA